VALVFLTGGGRCRRGGLAGHIHDQPVYGNDETIQGVTLCGVWAFNANRLFWGRGPDGRLISFILVRAGSNTKLT